MQVNHSFLYLVETFLAFISLFNMIESNIV